MNHHDLDSTVSLDYLLYSLFNEERTSCNTVGHSPGLEQSPLPKSPLVQVRRLRPKHRLLCHLHLSQEEIKDGGVPRSKWHPSALGD